MVLPSSRSASEMSPQCEGVEDDRLRLGRRAQAALTARTQDALLPANEVADDDTPRGSSYFDDRFHDVGDRAATPLASGRRARASRLGWQPTGHGGETTRPARWTGYEADTLPKNPQSPALNTRRSSESTAEIGGSPQLELHPESTKTDDEGGGCEGKDRSGDGGSGIPPEAFSVRIQDPARHMSPQAHRERISWSARDGYGRSGAGTSVEAIDGGGNPTLETAQEGDDEDGDADDDHGVVARARKRGGSLLDAYRESDGHDWGELEDWQGLPGLGLAAGGVNREGITPNLHAPALVFRSGRVVEDDVLSLLGRPRSRQPGENSPRTGPEQGAIANSSGQVSLGGVDGEPTRTGEGNNRGCGEADGFWRRRGVTGAGAVGGDTIVDELGGMQNIRGSGAQPLLVSLADLTTAGLEKMLQAEGDSKMYFDPEAQRWVGDDVDLSGFDDPLPGQASSPQGVTPGSPMVGAPPRRVRHAESPRLRVSPGIHRRWSSSGDGVYRGPASRPPPPLHGFADARLAMEAKSTLAQIPAPVPPSASSLDGVLHRRCSSESLEVVKVCPTSESGSVVRRSRCKPRSGSGSRASSLAHSSLWSDSDTGSIMRLPRGSPTAQCNKREKLSGGGHGSGGEAIPADTGACLGRWKSVGVREERHGPAATGIFAQEAGSTGLLCLPASDEAGWEGAGESASRRRERRSSSAWLFDAPIVSPQALLAPEVGQASESEIEASEASDWNEDSEFEDLPKNQTFELTFEQPEKFGYSPSALTLGVSIDGGSRRLGRKGGERGSSLPPTFNDLPPASFPDLFRHSTAPVISGSPPAAGDEKLGFFVQWPLKAASSTTAIGDRVGGKSQFMKNSGRSHQRTFTDYRCDSLGSAAEWDNTLEGDLDLSLAHKPRAPSGSGSGWQLWPRSSSTKTPPRPSAAAASAALISPPPRNGNQTGPSVDGLRGGGDTESAKGTKGLKAEEEGLWAVGRAWKALRAHRDDDALQATIRAAAAVTSIVSKHLRKRSQNRLFEKGLGSGRRMSGPMQITLEDLQESPTPGKVSESEGGEGSGDVEENPHGTLAAATGAFFNRENMRWEGFEEPDLLGFETSDSEPEPEPRAPSTQAPRSPLLMGSPTKVLGASSEYKGGVIDARCPSRLPLELSPAAPEQGTWTGIDGGVDGRSAKSMSEGVLLECAVDAEEQELKGTLLKGDKGGDGGKSVGGGFEGDHRRAGDVGNSVCGDNGGSSRRGGKEFDDPSKTFCSSRGKASVESWEAEEKVEWKRDAHAHRGGGQPPAATVDNHEPGVGPLPGDNHDHDSAATTVVRAAQTFTLPKLSNPARHAAEGVEVEMKETNAERCLSSTGVSKVGYHLESDLDVDINSKSSTSSSSSRKVSDWDRSLESPIPGLVAYAAHDDGEGDRGSNTRPALVCKLSSPLSPISGPRSSCLDGLAKGSVLFDVQPGPKNGAVDGDGGVVLALAQERGDGNPAAFPAPVKALASAGITKSPAGTRLEWAKVDEYSCGTMVTRSIYGAPSGEAFPRENCEADVRANISYITKSTDDTVDDWANDFMDVIVLTPNARKTKSAWRRGVAAFQEEDEEEEDNDNDNSDTDEDDDDDDDNADDGDDTLDSTGDDDDDSHVAACNDSPLRSRHPAAASGIPFEAQQLQGLFDELYPPHERPADFTDDDETSWSAPEMSAAGSEGGVPFGGGSFGEGVWAEEEGMMGRGRWRNYGPAIKRVSIDGLGGVFSGYRKQAVSGGDAGLFSSADEEDGPGQIEESDYPRRRAKRSRGYQTITKAEYTPIYVPNAWLNPETKSWEPVDGFEVDMSGFGGDSDDSASNSNSSTPSIRRKAPPPLSLPVGNGGSMRSDGTWASSLGSPPMGKGLSIGGTESGTPTCHERRRSLRASAMVNREAAFRLSPETTRCFARNEEAHDQAMSLLFGEKGYARSKKKGAARLQRLPGVSALREEEVLPTLALPEPAQIPSPPPRPRTRSLGVGSFGAWARSGSRSSFDSPAGSPLVRSDSTDSRGSSRWRAAEGTQNEPLVGKGDPRNNDGEVDAGSPPPLPKAFPIYQQQGAVAPGDGGRPSSTRGSDANLDQTSAVNRTSRGIMAWPELPRPRRREGRMVVGFQRGAGGKISGGGRGRSAFTAAARRAPSSRRAPRVLRSPPQRGLTEASTRKGMGIQRRAAISSPSMFSEVCPRRLPRTSSSGGLSDMLPPSNSGKWRLVDRLAGSKGEVAEDAAVVLAEDRARVKRRLARFDDMAAFAVSTTKDRFSLLGAINFSEAAPRRTHRRRRSGGESSAGSGSSAGRSTAVSGPPVWRSLTSPAAFFGRAP